MIPVKSVKNSSVESIDNTVLQEFLKDSSVESILCYMYPIPALILVFDYWIHSSGAPAAD